MSFLDRQGILEALVRNRVEISKSSEDRHTKRFRAIRHLKRIFDYNKNGRKSQGGHDGNDEHDDRFEDDVPLYGKVR